jgi:hypothetical protein
MLKIYSFKIYKFIETTGAREKEYPSFFNTHFAYLYLITFLYHFISFFHNLTCSYPYSYNLVLIETYMCRPYIYSYYPLITGYIGLTHVRNFIENKYANRKLKEGGCNSVSRTPVIKTYAYFHYTKVKLIDFGSPL